MLRQVSLVALLVFLLSALLLLDFKAAQRRALVDHAVPPSFSDHLLDVPFRLARLLDRPSQEESVGLSARLTRMLPAAPEGWTIRPVEESDVKALLARRQKDDDPAVASLIRDLLSEGDAKGAATALQVYARKDRLVVFKLVRQPDSLFADPANLPLLDALLGQDSLRALQDFGRVRGLDISELILPEKTRARIFTAGIGAQLRLWVVASDRLQDEDLVPFLETLDVKAMNAAVLDPESGVGDVPVIVLVSDLNPAARSAYEADRAARAADRDARLAQRREALAAAPAVEGGKAAETGCRDLGNGVTVCATGG